MLSLVHGVSFRQEACLRAYHAESKKPKCWLEAEPDNLHDCHAVKVFVNGEHVGYIPRTCTPQAPTPRNRTPCCTTP